METVVGMIQINNRFSGQDYLPLSIGLLQAYTRKYMDQSSDRPRFLPLICRRDSVETIVHELEDSNVAAFSVYLWNMNFSLEIARRLKERKPQVLTVFGGPQIPNNAENFLRHYPFVDIVCHGEGEQVFLEILRNWRTRDWSQIQAVSYLREDGSLEHHPRKSRISDLSTVPSPFLGGVFDPLIGAGSGNKWVALWETNRGCPFSCAFCQWGERVLNKVYCFDMERLAAEIEWFAEKKIEFVFCCDANFGMLDREMTVTELLVKAKEKYGYPMAFSSQSGKNTTETIFQIYKALSDHGMNKGVALALQSVNPDTLLKIRRKNISLDTFDQLHRRFKLAGIETFTDLIIGLPGETYRTFVDGVSTIIEKGQHNRIQFINLSILPNAEMGDPAFQKEYGMITVESRIINVHGVIEQEKDDIPETQILVVGTKTMPQDDWIEARVYSWVVSLIYFNKLLQIPLALLHTESSIGYEEMFHAFMTAGDWKEFPVLSDALSFFDAMARGIRNGGPEYHPSKKWLNIWWPADEYLFIKLCAEGRLPAFYEESERILCRLIKNRGVKVPEFLREALELNRAAIKQPFQKEDLVLDLSHNVWDVYQAALAGNTMQLQSTPIRHSIDRSSNRWSSWADWAREVVWYGNKRGAYLYSVRAEMSRTDGGSIGV